MEKSLYLDLKSLFVHSGLESQMTLPVVTMQIINDW